MLELQNYYNLIKEEFKNNTYLSTCKEVYDNSKYKLHIRQHLKEMGFKCSPEMESTLFFALVDIVVVVDSSNKFYYATFSESKLLELKQSGRLLPKNDDLDFSKASSLVKANTFSKINEFLAEGKFHFIKLTNLDEDSFYCNISNMNPYPALTDERVYSADFIAKSYWGILNLLVRDMYRVNDLICTASPTFTKQINNCAISCKINVKTIEESLESIYLWDIKTINLFTESDNIRKLLTGVCKVNDTYVTLNREVLEKFYGTAYLDFESKGVRERYCLEELYSTGEKADLRYYLNKYHFYNDEKLKSCKSTRELKLVLKSRMKPIKMSSKNINVRVLTSPKSIYSKHKSYYKNISLSSNFEVVDNLEEVLPQTYKVSGVSSFGYCSVEVKAISFGNAESNGKQEFIRQFGNLYNDKILGIQRGSEVAKGKHPVFSISIDTQRKLCEVIRWGYVKNYDEYSKLIRGIINTLNLPYEVTDDMIKLLFINNLAKEAGKSNKVTLEILGTNLDRFLTLLVKGSKESLERKIKELRKKK